MRICIMKRTRYKGYIIDTDDLGRPYIYDTAFPYRGVTYYIRIVADRRSQLDLAKAIIDARIEYGADFRTAKFDGKKIVIC